MPKNKDCENFRAWVVASAISLALALAFNMFGAPPSEPMSEAFAWVGFGALIDFESSNFLYLAWILIYGLAHVLAFFFVHYSRWLLVASLLLGLVLSIVSGISVGEPFGNALWGIHYVIQPFFIGMAFFSPAVRAAFSSDALRVAARSPFSQAQDNRLVPPDDAP